MLCNIWSVSRDNLARGDTSTNEWRRWGREDARYYRSDDTTPVRQHQRQHLKACTTGDGNDNENDNAYNTDNHRNCRTIRGYYEKC